MVYYKKSFTPKKPVKTFRDLDVYQKPPDCAMAVPLLVAEAHSLRFADFALGVGYLEKAMSASNKMVVYLEHAKGLCGSKFDTGLIDDLIGRYALVRTKM